MLTDVSYESAEQVPLLNGFATAISSWLLLAGPGKSGIGGSRDQGQAPVAPTVSAIHADPYDSSLRIANFKGDEYIKRS
jgi:hypothetical protein